MVVLDLLLLVLDLPTVVLDLPMFFFLQFRRFLHFYVLDLPVSLDQEHYVG